MKNFNRRSFIITAGLSTAAVLSGATNLSPLYPGIPLSRQNSFKRQDVNAKEFPIALLHDYNKAVETMLRLPPSDPRNWYRQALIHILDCPHGNFWFLPWHRIYLGWFEKICRELSANSSFALPYWNWSQVQRVPASFFTGALDPTSDLFLASYDSFKERFEETMTGFWSSLNDQQREALNLRGFNSLENLMLEIDFAFVPKERARLLTAQQPEFHEALKPGIGVERVSRALSSRSFVGFGGQLAGQHSERGGPDLLEAVPHNYVHIGIAGMMFNNLSPVDPLFYLHHCNVDRIWEVWNGMQVSEGLPVYPQNKEFEDWSAETFEFFVDQRSEPIANPSLQDYLQKDLFDYSYEPLLAGETRPPPVKAFSTQTVYAVRLNNQKLSETSATEGAVRISQDLLEDALKSNGATLIMKINMQYPVPVDAWEFSLSVNPNNGSDLAPADVGKLIIFGAHGGSHHQPQHIRFVIDLNLALSALNAEGGLDTRSELIFTLHASLTGKSRPGGKSLDVHEMKVQVLS